MTEADDTSIRDRRRFEWEDAYDDVRPRRAGLRKASRWLAGVLGISRFDEGHGGWRIRRKEMREEVWFDLVRVEDEEGRGKWTKMRDEE